MTDRDAADEWSQVAITRQRQRLDAAIKLLQRAYDSGHRHGWEPGESTNDAMAAIHSFLENETDG